VSKNWHDITLALAGIFQASGLVEQLAKTGYVPSDAYRCSIESLFILDPPDALSVYGNLANMQLGLEILQETLSPGNQRARDSLRYALGVLHLQKKLRARKDMLGVLGSRLKQAARQAEHFTATHDNVIGNLGDLYKETLSTFRFRIQVVGDQGYLQQPRIANQVRALLLAGIRSATLWRQVGGNRWQLLFHRKRLAATVDQLLRQAKAEHARHLH
jgi:high frequency lysogenization protein